MHRTDGLAVIGLGSRVPGAGSVNSFAELLSSGGVATAELPDHRLDRRLYLGSFGELGRTYCTIGGVVPDLSDDPALRSVDPDLLADYDQPYRHLLATAFEALAGTNCDPSVLSRRRTGVFVGHARGSLQAARLACATWIEDTVARLEALPLWREIPEAVRQRVAAEVVETVRSRSPRRKPGGAPFITPSAGIGLLPRVLGCTGPVVAIDAACASSFQALAAAWRAIDSGECELAIVGGASYNNLHSLILFSQAQALSRNGSFPFDSRADGFVGSDGYATVIVTRPETALELGAPIYAVVRSIGESCDGRGKSLWAPRREGQLLAIRRAWYDDLDRRNLGYIEAHATSTQLGDTTELEAISEAFRDAAAPIPIGSVKANIGHTREAAGLSSLIKVILSMRQGQIPHSPYLGKLQEGFDWAHAPVYVPTTPQPWGAVEGIRRACINSFGIGGLNVHVVIDDRVPERRSSLPVRRPQSVGIVGRGCVLPGAVGTAAFERLLRSGVSAIAEVPAERWNARLYCDPGGDPAWRTRESKGGFIRQYTFDWQRFKIPPKQLEHADPLHFWVLDSARQALEEAGYESLDRSRIAVVAGTIFGGDFVNQLSRCLHHPEFEEILRDRCTAADIDAADELIPQFRERFLTDIPVLHDDSGGFTASTLASRVARTFDLMGGAYAMDAGEASSEMALRCAAAMLEGDRLDAVLVIGAQRLMDMTGYIALASRGRDVLPGEGAAAVVLRRSDDARAVKARVFGMFSGSVPPGVAASRVGHTLGASGMVSLLESTLSAEPPRTAFMFSGQGAQYAGMLRQLVEQSAAARAAVAECDHALAASGQPSFRRIAWDDADSLGTDVLRTQLAILCADTILWRALDDLRIRPDVVAGYSYGDFAALVAAGSITLQEAVAITVERCRCIEDTDSDGLLVALPLSRTQAETTAQQYGELWTSIDNGLDQTILGGRGETIRALAAGTGARILNVPRPFHTPLLAGAAAAFASYLEGTRFRVPRTPFFGTLDCRYIADPDDIRDYLVRHLTSTVDYGKSVQRLARECPTAFIEVGPRAGLTALHRQLLGHEARVFATDSGSKPLQRVQAAVSGVPEIVVFDATRRRRERNLAASGTQIKPSPAEEQDELTASLIRFVCEQTGYPVELVELDADLEADLGIDSIRKAQLLGEMRERYGFTVTGIRQLSLADFPTLRSIRDFIRNNGTATAAPRTSERARNPTTSTAAVRQEQVVELKGSPYDIGLVHAQRKKREIEAVLTEYYQLAGAPTLEDDRLLAMVDRAGALLGDSGLSELQGIARGLDRSLLEVLTYNIALCPDYLPGCSQFVAPGPEGFIHAANEDSGLAIHLKGILRPFAQIRRVAGHIPHLLFTLPGRVGGLNGINRAGVCVTSALLLDRPAPDADASGLIHPVLVQDVLSRAETLSDALTVIRSATRIGAWSMMVSAAGQSRYIEYDGDELHESDATSACTNHALYLHGAGRPEHSEFRLTRLLSQLQAADSRTFAGASAILRDLFDEGRQRVVAHPTMNTIRRADNLYSALFLPEKGEVWWTGSSGEFQRIDAREVLAPEPSVKSRCVLRAVEDGTKAALPSALPFRGSVSIVGTGPEADAIRNALEGFGINIADEAEHLVILTGRQEPADYAQAAADLHVLLQSRIASTQAITALTAMGGDFGFNRPSKNAWGGAVTGLLKAIRREYPEKNIRVVDFPEDEPPTLIAESICAELGSGSCSSEVGYARRIRSLVRAIPEQAAPVSDTGISVGDVWVITGGGRGITSLVAEELRRRYDLRMHVLGTAERGDLPFARYHRCDVANTALVARTLDTIRAESGPIRGILHGAGFESSAGFLNKDLGNVRRTLDVKVTGALNLLKATEQDDLSHFLSFASISGRFGGFGQSDYAMASDLLAKLMQRVRVERPGVRSVAFHWPAWAGTGMAMRPESKLVLELAGHDFLPAEQGVQHVIDEIEAGCPEPEILIAFGTEPLDTESMVLRSRSRPRSFLVDRFLNSGVTETILDPSRHLFLRDHRWRSTPMLPAAAMLALLAGDESAWTIEDFSIANPLMIGADPVRVRTRIEGDGKALLYTERRNSAGKLIDPVRPIASAVLRRAARIDAAAPGTAPETAEWHTVDYPDEPDRIFFGETMRTIREFAAVPEGGVARGIAGSHGVVPLLDACFVACGIYCRRRFTNAVLVHGADRIVLTRNAVAGEPVTVRLRYRNTTGRIHVFDVLLAGGDGQVFLQADGVRLIAMEAAAHV